MKKIAFIFVLCLTTVVMNAQSTATLSFPDIALYDTGEFAVPLELSAISNNRIVLIQISFHFDESKIQWMGSTSDPGAGVSYINPLLTPLGDDWLWDYNTPGNLTFLWTDPTYNGVQISPPSNLIVFRFNYPGGLPGGEATPLSFSLTIKTLDDSESKTINELIDENFELYSLTLINDSVCESWPPFFVFDLKAYLEGPFNGSAMNTDLNDQNRIPLIQPYNTTPWNYTGSEQVSSIPNPDIVDWGLVELRETTGDPSSATPDKMIYRQAAFIKADGGIVGLDGSSLISYSGIVTSNLYVVIWHRNHLAVMSSAPLTESGGVYTWDFSDQLNKAYLDGQKDIGGGIFGMLGGDCNADGWVNILDKNENWTNEAGEAGYYSCDANMDTEINNIDKDEIWLTNKNEKLKLPEGFAHNCGEFLVDDRDDQVYTTVQIGSQCWMAKNLNIGGMIEGSINQTNNSVIEKYCYDNNSANCEVYGGLYLWDEMMQYTTNPGVQGICPAGWHLPDGNELLTLNTFLGGEEVAGGKMKSTGTIESGTGLWFAPNTGATNVSGFTALSGGEAYYSYFGELGSMAAIHSSTDDVGIYMVSYSSISHLCIFTDFQAASVRCISDIAPPWTCGLEFNDSRDGQTYNTVNIGTQCWMAENLNIGTLIPGTNNMENDNIIEKYCYDNSEANCDIYGGLYQWNEMMQYSTLESSQGICPEGWHLPDFDEWQVLSLFLAENIGGKMKTTGTIEEGNGLWHSPNFGATNESGFSGLPSGYISIGIFGNLSHMTNFWTSTVQIEPKAYFRRLYRMDSLLGMGYLTKECGFSVRCLKD